MSAMTNIEEAAFLDYRFRNQATLTSPLQWYAALFTLAPGETGGGTEVSGFGYARMQVDAADWDAVTAGEPSTIENLAQKLFAQASGGNWGTVVAVGFYLESTAGDLRYYATLGTSKTVNDGDNAKFNAGALKVGMS